MHYNKEKLISNQYDVTITIRLIKDFNDLIN